MKVIVNIITTKYGLNLREAESNKLIGTVNEGRNKPGIYLWETFGDAGWASLEQALYTIKEVLSQRAANLGLDIEFKNI